MKLSEAFNGYEITRRSNLSPTTMSMYLWAFKVFNQFTGDIEVEQVDVNMLRRFYNHLAVDYKPTRMSGSTEPLKPRSVENIWTALRSFYNWAEIELKLPSRPDKNIPRPRYYPEQIVPFTDEEILKILKACEYANDLTPKT